MPHKHDNSILMRRTFRTAATYTPFIITVLGWPWMAAGLLQKTGI
ncbi:unnamed protein product, partial [Aureobasidium pullulans]